MPVNKLYTWEYDAFKRWYKSVFGADAPAPPNDESLKTLPAWAMFEKAGKPGFVSMVSPEMLEKEQSQAIAEQSRWVPPEGYQEVEQPPWQAGGFGSEQEWRVAMGLELDPWQEWQKEYQQRQLDLQEANAQRQAQYQEWQMSQPSDVALRQQLWEAQQESDIASMTAPSDWITRWMRSKGLQKQRDVRKIRKNIDIGEQKLEEQFHTATPSEFDILERRVADLYNDLESAKERDIGTPEAPQWLARFAPSQTGGEPITKQKTVTPSGQQWIATPWSEREGLRGYMDWSGGRGYQDMLNQMAMMQPKTPYVTGRWSPARQRV